MSQGLTPIQFVQKTTAEFILSTYRMLLFDAYGVLVDASGVRPHAAEYIRAVNMSGKPYFIVSNDASRPPDVALARYRAYGLELRDGSMITSGGALTSYFKFHGLVGAKCVVLGTSGSCACVQSAGGSVVNCREAFDAVVVADEEGFDWQRDISAVISALAAMIRRGGKPRLILANSDVLYPRSGTEFGLGAGAVAALIVKGLGTLCPSQEWRFEIVGKPAAFLFEEALRRAGGQVDKKNVVMIGDQLGTDILGACNAGIPSALILGGVSSVVSTDPWSANTPRPTYLLESLALQ